MHVRMHTCTNTHTHTHIHTHTHPHSHIQSEEAPLRMTYTAYAHFNRGYFEKDRLLFSLTVALEVNKL